MADPVRVTPHTPHLTIGLLKMNKTTKGVVAAGAAAVLLTGGVGSLAFWTTTGTANGGSITSGNLAISAGTCDANWVYAPGAQKAGTVVTLFVPGDKVTKSCTFNVTATGQNLSAAVTAPTSLDFTYAPAAASASITTASTYTVTKGGTSRAIVNGGAITSADDASVLTATFVATIPFGTNEAGTPKVNANDTKSIVATLNTLTVNLAQNNPN